MNAVRVRQTIVGAVAAHSLFLGAVMLLCPLWVLGRTGWSYEGPPFFPAQSGLFLLILGGGYAAGVRHRSFAWFLIGSKAAAVLFLVAAYALGHGPPVMLAAAALDGVMGLSVITALRLEKRADTARDNPRTGH